MPTRKQQDPAIDIPASSARNPQEVQVTLEFDTPNEKDKGDYTLYIYSVRAAAGCRTRDGDPIQPGQKAVMFAYDGLKNAIDETGAGKGTTIGIIRTGTGKDTRWDVEVLSGNTRPQEDRPVSSGKEPRRNDPVLDQDVNDVPDFYMMVAQYAACFQQAAAMAVATLGEERVTHEGTQATAFSLMRMALDRGISVPLDALDTDAPPFDADPEPEPESDGEDGDSDPFEVVGEGGAKHLLRAFRAAGIAEGDEAKFTRAFVPKAPKRLADLTPEQARKLYDGLRRMHTNRQTMKEAGIDANPRDIDPIGLGDEDLEREAAAALFDE